MLYCAGCWAVVRIGVIDGGNTDADADANAVQAGFTPPKPRPGMNSYAFMWSIPNMVPLAPHVILRIWKAIRPFEFTATHGLFVDWDVEGDDVKGRVLDSMKIQVRSQGFEDALILREKWP